MLFEPPVDLLDNEFMIGRGVGPHKEPKGEEVTVLLVELGDDSLLWVET